MPSNIKVLLVDDNPMILEMLRQALGHFSTVQTLSDAADALLKAIEDKPDLIIADYAMNGMDGRQLLQKIKSRNASACISRDADGEQDRYQREAQSGPGHGGRFYREAFLHEGSRGQNQEGCRQDLTGEDGARGPGRIRAAREAWRR